MMVADTGVWIDFLTGHERARARVAPALPLHQEGADRAARVRLDRLNVVVGV